MISIIVAALVGVALGSGLTAIVLAGRSATRLAAAEVGHTRSVADIQAELARTAAALTQERAAAEERRVALEETKHQLTGEFAELSRKALAQNNAQFLELADARLKQTQQSASGELEKGKLAIEQMLTPIREQLGKYEEGIRLIELERKGAYSALTEQVRHMSEAQHQLQAETRNLVTALRTPSTRGRWGEMQLRRVVELAGMVEHCDFDEQVTTDSEDGRMRPDMIVHLPGARCVVVDAKVPLQAFLEAIDATDEDQRRAHLQAHARQLRTHVDSLAKKGYWQGFDRSAELVVAFVPGEPLLSSALEHDPSLFEHALSNHIVLATPNNLIALLRTFASSWREEEVAENAREVQRIGRDLYKRLSTFTDHLGRVGKGLGGAVDAYNEAVGSLERRVLPQARRFQDLGVVGIGDKEMPELEAVDSVPRRPETADLAPGGPALELVVDSPEPLALPGVADG